MSADKIRKNDQDIKEIHTNVKKSSLILKQRMKDIQQELENWNLIGGENEEGNGSMF